MSGNTAAIHPTTTKDTYAMKGFNPLAALTNAVKELAAKVETLAAKVETLAAKVETLITEVREVRSVQKQHTEMLELLVAEVSRYKNDSGELLVSVYAYCTVNGIKFSHGDLFKWGGKATRFSRKHGFKIEQTNDPRFGEVNLYEQTVLDNVVDM